MKLKKIVSENYFYLMIIKAVKIINVPRQKYKMSYGMCKKMLISWESIAVSNAHWGEYIKSAQNTILK